jgi:septum formation protein
MNSNAANHPLRPPLILASTSRYRKELLQRLGVPFECVGPHIDEAQRAGESPLENCRRLALEKALHVSTSYSQCVVIGSDQVLDLEGEALSKPESMGRSIEQLTRCQGKTIICYTALAVIAPHSLGRVPLVDVVATEIVYRNLPHAELIAYLEREKPFDAAGAVKVETSGIALLSAVRSDDPTAIIGLPLIRLTDFLRQLGVL